MSGALVTVESLARAGVLRADVPSAGGATTITPLGDITRAVWRGTDIFMASDLPIRVAGDDSVYSIRVDVDDRRFAIRDRLELNNLFSQAKSMPGIGGSFLRGASCGTSTR